MGLRIIRKQRNSDRLRKKMIRDAAKCWSGKTGDEEKAIGNIFNEKLEHVKTRLTTSESATSVADTISKSLNPSLYDSEQFDIEKLLNLLEKPANG